jgi:hypothetical protein
VDEDLETMMREQLMIEAKRLRAGIRKHRDSTGHDLCWHHPALWGLLPERTDPQRTVPSWPECLRGCLRTGSRSRTSCRLRRARTRHTSRVTGSCVLRRRREQEERTEASRHRTEPR